MDIPSNGAAFVAGLASFLSPCVLPMVPGYLSVISGVGIEQLQEQEPALLRKVMLNSVAFIIGFSVVFGTLGALTTAVSEVALYKVTLGRVAGVVIIVFGLHLTGIMPIKFLYVDKRLHNLKGGSTVWGAFVVGFAFAFGWTPCIGLTLTPILILAGHLKSIAQGVLLLAIYSMGLAIPFLLAALGIGEFLKFYGRFRRHMHIVEIASGGVLIALGLLLAIFGKLDLLAHYFSPLNRFVL